MAEPSGEDGMSRMFHFLRKLLPRWTRPPTQEEHSCQLAEGQWLFGREAEELLEHVRYRASERKLRLFVCAYLRRASGVDHLRPAIEITEGYIDGAETLEHFRQAWAKGYGLSDSELILDPGRLAGGAACPQAEEVGQVGLLRDIFGNPFRPVAVDPAWRTATVVSLAQAIYDERAFDRLPILADALEDGGCTNADVLDHCRQPGEHVRGCWVVDLVLGKE
jgi:hypothetical protein